MAEKRGDACAVYLLFFCANKSKISNFQKRALLSRRRGEGGDLIDCVNI